MRKMGLYVHIPFCQERCTYCDFLTFPHAASLHRPYIRALIKEIHLLSQEGEEAGRKDRPSFLSDHSLYDSLYIGGGTPSFLGVEEMAPLLEALTTSFPMEEGAEFTIEANPASLDEEKLALYREYGVNRISLGVQSMSEDLLKACGRTHRPEAVFQDAEAIRRAGIKQLNLDFIYAIPGQTWSDMDGDLAAIRQIQPSHLSWYSLIVEEKTLMKRWVEEGRIRPFEGEEELAAFSYLREGLLSMGFQQYEISNFCQPGCFSRHNLKYWTGQEYLGLGLGASSYLRPEGDGGSWRRGERFKNPSRFQAYLQAVEEGEDPAVKEERSDQDDLFEQLMMGFRKIRGIDRRAFCQLNGCDPLDLAPSFFKREREEGMVDWNAHFLFQTEKGLQLQNRFLVGLLEAMEG